MFSVDGVVSLRVKAELSSVPEATNVSPRSQSQSIDDRNKDKLIGIRQTGWRQVVGQPSPQNVDAGIGTTSHPGKRESELS